MESEQKSLNPRHFPGNASHGWVKVLMTAGRDEWQTSRGNSPGYGIVEWQRGIANPTQRTDSAVRRTEKPVTASLNQRTSKSRQANRNRGYKRSIVVIGRQR
jgi:hypothetical protein